MPYIYRITRGQTLRKARVRAVPSTTTINDLGTTPSFQKVEPAKPSYRDLQAEATALGIPAKQKAGKLQKAIHEAKRSGA